MSDPSPLIERLARVLADPTRGVLGLVDELLAASRRQDLRLTWQEGRCHLILSGGSPPARIEVPMPKSVSRAALARVAALCNERSPDSVSPYGGQGEVAIDADPATAVLVRFVNTPEEQRLEMASARPGVAPRDPGQSPTALAEDRGPFSLSRWEEDAERPGRHSHGGPWERVGLHPG